MQQVLLFISLASTLLVLGNALNICMVYDPEVVEIINGDSDAEGSNMLAAAEFYNVSLTLLTDIQNRTLWSEALAHCGLFIQPEPERGDPLPQDDDARDYVIELLRNWTTQGGVLVGCGDSNSLLYYVYDWDYSTDGFDSNTPGVFPRSSHAVFPFTDGPAAIGDWDGTYPPEDYPAEQCQYEIVGSTACAITLDWFKVENQTSPYEKGGAFIYLSYDFYNAFPVGEYGNDDYYPLLFQHIPSDCNDNNVVDWVELASNASLDCDENGELDVCQVDCDGNHVADACQILANTSLDCDENGELDVCQVDCDGNHVADACQILADASLDCDQNGELDTCQIEATPSLDCDENGELDECQPQPVQCVESSSTTGTVADGGDGDGDGDGESDSASSLRGIIFASIPSFF